MIDDDHARLDSIDADVEMVNVFPRAERLIQRNRRRVARIGLHEDHVGVPFLRHALT